MVCEGIDLATRIAYGAVRHRVVTLRGELIEKSGTMSGGGKPKTGGMSNVIVQEFSEDQINEAQSKVDILSNEIAQIRQVRPTFEESKKKNARILQDNQIKIQKAEIELNQFKLSMTQLDVRYQNFAKDLEKAS